MVQKRILTSVFGQTVFVFKYTNVDFLLEFSHNSVLIVVHVNEIDEHLADIIAGAFRFVWR